MDLQAETQDEESNPIDFSHDESNIDVLTNVLRDNLHGCDMLLCLFVTALQSYRVDTCLRPFPTIYIKDSQKDLNHLRAVCDNIPPLHSILQTPQMCSKEIIHFLLWLFCQKDQPSLQKINFNTVTVPSPIKKSLQPYYTYEVLHPPKAEDTWQKRKKLRNSFLGYHGSQLDNFYSILKVGLQHHFGVGKEVLYGKGVYLTTEITISMPYAPFGSSWKNSILGNKFSVIALCEVIDDIDKVKCKDENFKERAVNQGSISGNIPDKYFVVTDTDMIRLKYLFVYKENTVTVIESWLFKNLTLVLICAYIFILFCIGFFQGPTWPKILRYLNKILFSD